MTPKEVAQRKYDQRYATALNHSSSLASQRKGVVRKVIFVRANAPKTEEELWQRSAEKFVERSRNPEEAERMIAFLSDKLADEDVPNMM